ncbi:MAG: MBL fold metallo-hydrolase [Bacteroidetes bacterium]|nr:MBL fold metallo-hydrolase [Bacteroidota bacterium]
MQLHVFTFNPLQENTYVIWDENSMECAIVDPGNYNSTENQILRDFILNQNLNPVFLLGTHAHIDHIFGNWFVKHHWNISYLLHSDGLPMFHRSEQMAALWGLNYTPSPMPDLPLEHRQKLNIGNTELEIRLVPGHAPGHVIFVNHSDRWVIGGDTLFKGSIGRTDLPGGDHELLLEKIREEMFTLPDDYLVYSGHGPETNIGFERNHNPFF